MIVAIGGSAGGLVAFRGLIAGLPPRSGIAFILVQHLDPDHPSMLADLLAADTPFPVVEIVDGMVLKPDTLHVIPAGGCISVANRVLRLEPMGPGPSQNMRRNARRNRQMPIDFLLQSLARETGVRVVAVILSGNGEDGSAGARAIHAAGGIVIVQEPTEARNNSMPLAAIATGCADAVLPVAAIGTAIIDSKNGHALPKSGVSAIGWLEAVLGRLHDGGHDFTGYKPGTMQRRIERRARMAGHQPEAMDGYIARLAADSDELQTLANDLLINVTGFFRDEEVFASLSEKILPDLVRRHSGDGPLRLWCAGCSSGEEAWSLAMIVAEEISRSRPELILQMFATDLDAEAITTARKGQYPPGIEKYVSATRLQRFFLVDDHGWRVSPALQATVVFAVHDLLTDPPFSRMDMVSCRNLLIYLQPAAQARAISLFHFALHPGGLLLLGSAEAVADPLDAAAPGFTLVEKGMQLYRRNASRRDALPHPMPTLPTRPAQVPAMPSTAERFPPINRLKALEAELASIRTELANVNRDLEGADAQKIATHADTLSRNEEYQTANEELLTSQEELQSLNEELVALNGQLQETIDRERSTANDLQNILNSTDVATIFLDMDSNIRFFTPASRALFNMLPGDIGRPLADLAPLTPDPQLTADIVTVRNSHNPIECEVETSAGICFNRQILPYLTHDRQVAGVIITYNDVTVRKLAEHAMREAREVAEAANLAKSRFLAAASHDLRQPLQALVLLQDQLMRKTDDPDTQALLVRLDHTLDAMAAMLNSLLDINSIEAGAVEVQPTVFALDTLLDETVQGMMMQAVARNLKLRHVRSGCNIVSDRRLLAGMLQNLVANALKYTTRGGVLLGVRRRGNQVEIEVWDSGIGIPVDKLEAVFKPFHQLEPAPSDRSYGLGLGLSIVRSLGDLLGHSVKLRSRPGKGSVFSISVPLADPPQAEPALLPAPVARPPAKPVPGKAAAQILVVDDDAELLDLIGRMLRDAGHAVTLASDAPAALAALQPPPDLIISDFRLEGPYDGLALARLLRESLLQSTDRVVPVIMLTGDISIDTLTRLSGEGCVRLAKPVRANELLAAVDAALGHAAAAIQFAADQQGVVHVIDDDPRLLHELGLLLVEAGLPVRMHGSSEAFRASWDQAKAGCLLIDAYLPGESGLELLHRLKTAGTLPPAIVITGHGDIAMAVDAMKAGALDFIEKPASGTTIIDSVRRALASGQNKADNSAGRAAAVTRLSRLTTRQAEVMTMVLAGHPSKNIAADLNLSQRTVENHRAEIMRRTGCKSLPELARLVMTADPEPFISG